MQETQLPIPRPCFSDRHSQERGGSSLAIYRMLEVPGCVVGDRHGLGGSHQQK